MHICICIYIHEYITIYRDMQLYAHLYGVGELGVLHVGLSTYRAILRVLAGYI